MSSSTPTPPLLLCCCGTYAMRPMLWLAMSLFFLVAGWWSFGYAGFYSRYWRPSDDVTALHWYHAVPGFLFTLLLPCTIGARLYRTGADGADDDDADDSALHNYYHDDNDCLRLHRHTVQMLRLMLIVALFVSAWATALMWSVKDWFEPALDPLMGYALLLQAFLSTLALLCRWRQLVVEFQIVRDKRLGNYNPSDEDGSSSM